jgi:hypothetical protein
MLGLVPVGGKLVRRTDEDRSAFDRECFGRRKPGLECLEWKLLAGTIKKEFPNFGGTKRHDRLAYRFYVEKSNEFWCVLLQLT